MNLSACSCISGKWFVFVGLICRATKNKQYVVDDYVAHYNCKPPPLFMILISLIEVSGGAAACSEVLKLFQIGLLSDVHVHLL